MSVLIKHQTPNLSISVITDSPYIVFLVFNLYYVSYYLGISLLCVFLVELVALFRSFPFNLISCTGEMILVSAKTELQKLQAELAKEREIEALAPVFQ